MISAEQIAKWRSRRGYGFVSAVGEYTPDEFWEVLDLLEQQAERIRQLENGYKALQQDLALYKSYTETDRVCNVTIPGGGFTEVAFCKLPRGHKGPHQI